MYSAFIRVLLAMFGLSPVLIALYIVRIIHDFKKLSIYIKLTSIRDFWIGIVAFLEIHYLLILFIIIIIVTRTLINKAIKTLSTGRMQVKSIKPGDANFVTLLFSIILPFYKFYDPTIGDIIYMNCFILIAITYGIAMKTSYHFNIVLKLFLGYSHYEIATTGEISYLLLSKNKLVNKNQVSEYVYLTDYMLINTSEQKTKKHA